MSNTDSHVHKKVGLAKLAKARSISNGINSLGLESTQEDKAVNSVPTKEGHHSPLVETYSDAHQGLAVSTSANEASTVLLDKMKIRTMANHKDIREEFGETNVVNTPSAPVTDSETKENILEKNVTTAKSQKSERSITPEKEQKEVRVSRKKSFIQSLNRKSFRKKKIEKEEKMLDNGSLSSSPIENQLRVPKPIMRSRSLSRLSDAFTQVQNVCLTPTRSRRESEGNVLQPPPASSPSTLMVASHPLPSNSPYLRVQSSKRKTELSPTLINKAHSRPSRSPMKSIRHTNKVSPVNSILKSSKKSEVSNLYNRTCSESRVQDTVPENKLSNSISCDFSHEVSHAKNQQKSKTKRNKNKPKRTKGNKYKDLMDSSSNNTPVMVTSDYGSKTNGSSNTSPASLTTSMPLSVKPNSKKKRMHLHSSSVATHRSGRPTSWCTFDSADPFAFTDDSSEEESDSQSQESEGFDESSRRWSSQGHLNEWMVPLGYVKPSEAKKKNYLFGGLGSLLGPTELKRYFPDRNVLIFIATWNMNGKEPPNSLDDFLLPDDMEHMPDMYVIGTQESSGDRTEWEVRLQTTIGPSHVLFHSAVLGILHLTVFLRRDLVWFCSVPEEGYHSLRPGTYFKTKGAIAISFQFFGTKMLFVNTHLFAHEENLSQRVQNYRNIVYNLDLPRNLRCMKMNRPKDVTNRYDVVFWLGDLNFRLVGPRDQILEKIKESSNSRTHINDLLSFDQLTQTRNKGEIFHGFTEGPISFAPTFKFDVGTNHYDSSSKQRVPSYTDRILYKSTRDPIKCTNYNSCSLFKTSDHKPVWGVFHFKVRPGKDDSWDIDEQVGSQPLISKVSMEQHVFRGLEISGPAISATELKQMLSKEINKLLPFGIMNKRTIEGISNQRIDIEHFIPTCRTVGRRFIPKGHLLDSIEETTTIFPSTKFEKLPSAMIVSYFVSFL